MDYTNSIEVHNLKKYYKDTKAVDGISLSIEKGKVTAILGPNGAGKTTTVETLEGLRKADSGEIYYFGEKIKEVDEKIKEKIGVQLQSSTFLSNLTVYETIKTFAGLYKKSLDVDKIIIKFNLEEKKKSKIKNLSGGQQQRVALACAVINDPEIVFLDEPTTGLDPQARRNLWTAIEELKKDGKTVVLTTHYMEEAEYLSDKIYIVDHGKIIAEGKVNELVKTINMKSVINFSVNHKSEIFSEYQKNEDGIFKTETSDIEKTLVEIYEKARKNDLTIENLSIRNPNLEDVFLHLTGRKLRD
ncbi:MAG TPA: ABC transporter ATP-binding protein [Tepiditoga sp.]|nr:ABC transporter ATP-binding protein [Tepiditoga sp.]